MHGKGFIYVYVDSAELCREDSDFLDLQIEFLGWFEAFKFLKFGLR